MASSHKKSASLKTIKEQEVSLHLEKFFNSSLGITLSSKQVVRELIRFMEVDTFADYKITIGSDYENKSNGTVDFVSAIVIHRVGNGGRYFWRRVVAEKKFHTLRERLLEEVLLSLETAHDLISTTKKLSLPEFSFEIHVDVGEHGKSKSMMQDLVGMVRANNFEARTKPDSYAASKVADRHT